MPRTYDQAAAGYYAAMAEDCANRWEEDVVEQRCIECNLPVTEFRDALSAKEFGITGLCQACQDEVFDDEDFDDDEWGNPDDDPVAW